MTTSHDDQGLSKAVWTTLITTMAYLPGVLTLDYSLKKSRSKYSLLVLYTDVFPDEGHAALDARSIPKRRVDYLTPKLPKDYQNDPRFYDCWTKLTPFGLTEYDRIVQLDGDMLVRQNMDELMEMPLRLTASGDGGDVEKIDQQDHDRAEGEDAVFAAAHACVCNPLHKAHYPPSWIPSNCAYTAQHADPTLAQTSAMPSTFGLGIPNGGLQVVRPDKAVYGVILDALADQEITNECDFADQSLLAKLFAGRWKALPYVYNALKTLRWSGVHELVWRDEQVKNVHYILAPKPWEEEEEEEAEKEEEKETEHIEKGSNSRTNVADPSHRWWRKMNQSRKRDERKRGITDGF